MKLRKALKIIWDETTSPLGGHPLDPGPRRYVAKALPDRSPGSHGWRVYDRKADRFLSDSEVREIKDPRECMVN